ncbi:MAG: hypothetical protein A2Z96_06975 [Spirochaetes bacterium GWB1_48_6]|nr:MAG: hypothetical protein A2Z96_06975 [Spirochaetes bacterium GWB1_48_6]
MEMHQIRYFLSIAKNGSFTAAAQDCHVAQPSLSSQIAKLEEELESPLFERSRLGTRLTPQGQLFLPRAQEIMVQVRKIRADLDDLVDLKRGEVTLGCLPTTGAYLLPQLLTSFMASYPHIQVKLREQSSPELGISLLKNEIDLALMDEAGLSDGLLGEPLFSEELLVALPPGHRFAKSSPINLSLLSTEPLILMKSGHGFRKIVLDALTIAGVTPHVVYESSGIDTVQALVEAGLGLSLVPKMVQKNPGPTYLQIAPPTPKRTLYLASREKSIFSPSTKALRELCFRCFRKGEIIPLL